MSYFHDACVAYWPGLERAEEPYEAADIVKTMRRWAYERAPIYIEHAVIMLRDYPGTLTDIRMKAIRESGKPKTIDAFFKAIADFLGEFLPAPCERICPREGCLR